MSRALASLTFLLAGLTAAAAGSGLLFESVYARESASWRAQAVGQDFVTLLVVVPLLVGYAARARAGSVRALLVWTGTIIYLVYSYTLYAFTIHFNPLFLVYVAILGLSVYLLIFGIAAADRESVKAACSSRAPVRIVSGFLWLVAGLFGLMWLAEILPALIADTTLKSADEAGLPVNPVHIMDLGLLFPGLIITAVQLRRRSALGYFLAAPLMVSLLLLGVAILAMVALMLQRGLPVPVPMIVIMGSVTFGEALLVLFYLRELRAEPEQGIPFAGPRTPAAGGAGVL